MSIKIATGYGIPTSDQGYANSGLFEDEMLPRFYESPLLLGGSMGYYESLGNTSMPTTNR